MTIKSRKFSKGIQTKPTTDAATLEGEQRTDSVDNKQKIYLDGAERAVVTEDQAQTLSNKTHTDPVLNGDVSGTAIDTDDTLAANSDTKIASQQAVKAYVDNAVAGKDDASEINYNNADSTLSDINVKDAIDSLDAKAVNNNNAITNNSLALTAHLTDTEDAHDASAISNIPSGNLAATDVQGALNELQTDVDSRALRVSGEILTPNRLDVKQDTQANLETYALTATSGQIVFATDTEKMFQIIDNKLKSIGGGGSTQFEITQTSHGLSVGEGIYFNGTSWVKALADNADTLAYYAVTEVPDANTFIAADFGRIEAASHGYTIGEYYFLSDSVAGQATTVEPASGFSNPLFFVEDANTLQIKVYRPSAVDSVLMDQLGDVSAPAPVDGDLIRYVGANNRYESYNVSGDVVSTDAFQDLTNKTIDGGNVNNANINTPNRLDVKKGTLASLEIYAATAGDGQLVFATDTQEMFQIINNALAPIGSGGVGGINYLEGDDSNFEGGVGNWIGTADLVLSQETSEVLRDKASLKIEKAALDASTQFISVPFTVDAADLAKKLTISFDYNASDVNYSDGDLRVEILQDPNGTPKTIRVNAEDIKAGKGTHYAQFQTDSSVQEYELVIKQIGTNANLVSVYIDNVVVGPTNLAFGAVVTDVKETTPVVLGSTTNPTFGTLTDNRFRYSRSGSYLIGQIVIVQTTAGSAGAGGYSIQLPDGLSVKSGANSASVGNAYVVSGGTRFEGAVTVGGNTIGIILGNSGSSFGGWNAVSHPISNADYQIYVEFQVEIEGWSSNAQMSEDLGGREVFAHLALTSNVAVGVGSVKTPFNTVKEDTVSGYDSVNDRYIIQESGIYDFTGNIGTASATVTFANILVFDKDDNIKHGFDLGTRTSETRIAGAGSARCVKGDYVVIESNVTVAGNLQGNADGNVNFLTIAKRASSQTMLETETVAARYTSNNGQAATTATTLVFEDLDADTHSAYNTSTGEYTVPVSGWYDIQSNVLFVSSAYSATQSVYLDVYLNGSFHSRLSDTPCSAAVTMFLGTGGSAKIPLSKGDIITVRATNERGSTALYSAAEGYNTFSIARIK